MLNSTSSQLVKNINPYSLSKHNTVAVIRLHTLPTYDYNFIWTKLNKASFS